MPRLLITLIALLLMGTRVFAADSWTAAVKRGDYETAATLLHRVVFEPERTPKTQDAAALKQLALLYVDGKGVPRDAVLGCGLLRAHAIAVVKTPRTGAAASRAAQTLVEKHCAPLTPQERAAAFAAMTCPRIGLTRGDPIQLEPGWTIQFNDRSATIVRAGQSREQALPGDLLCRSQVLLSRHSVIPATGRARARHVVEQVTVQSAWRTGTLTREIVWQLYEVRGLELDLAAVQRWQEPGSAWPAPSVPDVIARGVAFTAQGGGSIQYEIDDTRRGIVDARR
jgi:hypothetical protein